MWSFRSTYSNVCCSTFHLNKPSREAKLTQLCHRTTEYGSLNIHQGTPETLNFESNVLCHKADPIKKIMLDIRSFFPKGWHIRYKLVTKTFQVMKTWINFASQLLRVRTINYGHLFEVTRCFATNYVWNDFQLAKWSRRSVWTTNVKVFTSGTIKSWNK